MTDAVGRRAAADPKKLTRPGMNGGMTSARHTTWLARKLRANWT